MSNEDKPTVQGSINITDLLGLGAATKNLAPAGTEIVRAVSAGIGKIYEPASIFLNERARSAAERQNALADARAYLEIQTRSPAVLEAMKARLLHMEYRREENIIATSERAIAIAEQKGDPAKAEIDPDFMAEWIDGVKDISNEQLQEIWARILVEAPASEDGRVEKAITDFLRQLDPKMMRLLRQIYLDGAITGWQMPLERVEMTYIAEEVGLASTSAQRHLSMLGGVVSISANDDDTFQAVSLGERARRLGEIVYGKVDTLGQAAGFFDGFPEWLSSILSRNYFSTIHITVADMASVYKFTITTQNGELLTALPDFAPTHTQYVDTLQFGGAPYEEALKGALRRLAATKRLKFDHAWSHKMYGMKDYVVPGSRTR